METNAEQLLNMLKDEGEALIRSYIDKGTPETRFLDFKRKTDGEGTVLPSSNDMENYVKALSGFANAEGGILIWGVGEKKTVNGRIAFEDKAIKNVDYFISSLNSLLPGAVSKPIEGVSNFAIKKEGSNDGYAITYVPKSPIAPHRGELKLKNYFQRIGDNFIQMEHYQIEDMFGRRQQPSISAKFIFRKRHSPNHGTINYELILDLTNEGRSMASFIGVDFEFPARALEGENSGYVRFTLDKNFDVKRELALIRIRYNSREEGKAPLFPGETTRIIPNNYASGHINYHVNDSIHSAWHGKELKVTIYADSTPPKESKINFGNLNEF